MMPNQSFIAVVVASIVTAIRVSFAGATPITIAFAGKIDFVAADLPFSDKIEVGASFEGMYSYEPGTSDNFPSNPLVGSYSSPNLAMVASIGPLTFWHLGTVLAVYDHSSFDSYIVSTLSPFSANGVDWSSMNLYLVSNSGTAWTSDALPLDAPDLDMFTQVRAFDLVRPGQTESSILGEITWMGQVPEPGTLLALSAGSLFTLRRHRGRRLTVAERVTC